MWCQAAAVAAAASVVPFSFEERNARRRRTTTTTSTSVRGSGGNGNSAGRGEPWRRPSLRRRHHRQCARHREEEEEEEKENENENDALFSRDVSVKATVASCAAACCILAFQTVPVLEASPAMASSATEESTTTDGKNLFNGAGGCLGCHAAGGNILDAGKTLSLRDLTKNGMNGKEDVAEVISLGKNKMPGYGEQCVGKLKCTFAKRLTEKEIRDLSEFVWTTANNESEGVSWAKALK